MSRVLLPNENFLNQKLGFYKINEKEKSVKELRERQRERERERGVVLFPIFVEIFRSREKDLLNKNFRNHEGIHGN